MHSVSNLIVKCDYLFETYQMKSIKSKDCEGAYCFCLPCIPWERGFVGASCDCPIDG